MIELLKTHLQNKDAEQAIALIKKQPELLAATDKNGSSGLLTIAYSGLADVFAEAIKLKQTFTFHEAIVCGQLDAVQEYLATSANDLRDTYSNDGFTPLALAAFFNRNDIAQLLIEKGANPNLAATNPTKVNALHAAVAKGNYALCQLFIKNGADVNATQMQNVTPLHSAVHRGNLALTQLLVENGADINLKMENGDDALSIAKRDGHEEVIAYLLEK
ncbi:MAG: ankyrin repeat domain-containing protein [Saprospiraceae bacterium]